MESSIMYRCLLKVKGIDVNQADKMETPLCTPLYAIGGDVKS